MASGNWKRSCLEARNGEHDIHCDDDDQYVHRWQPNNRRDLPPNIDQPRLITFKQLRVWDMVSRYHHEVWLVLFSYKMLCLIYWARGQGSLVEVG
jgi:hypothetical protein